ncbi:MAG: hypothetical protein LUD81_04275 [Clostridiales bacterium]|nr:hypothetical protein [Clostridiales bacterium]
MNGVFIFGGKRYSPGNSDLLCKCNLEGFPSKALYVSPKGAFFTVEESDISGKTEYSDFELIDRETAKKFMDENPEGVEEEVYKKIFGEPEEG